MPEKTDYLKLIAEQKHSKPPIEDVVGSFLEGERLQNAMDFIKFLYENDMNPRWKSGNNWKVSGKKGKWTCGIGLGGGKHVWQSGFEVGDWSVGDLDGHDCKYMDEFMDCDETKEFIWKNVKPCRKCSPSGKYCTKLNKIYVGKLFPESCSFSVTNPNAKELEILKKLVAANKRFVPETAKK